MSQRITELEDGRVLVQIRSKRGTDTRDEDQVTVQAVYDDIDDAERDSSRLNQLVKDRLVDARAVGGDGLLREEYLAALDEETDGDYSKIYLGDGANMTGWIPVKTAIVENEIVPLVERFTVEDDDADTISVNFTSDVSISGWSAVDAGVVIRKIEPLVEKYRVETA